MVTKFNYDQPLLESITNKIHNNKIKLVTTKHTNISKYIKKKAQLLVHAFFIGISNFFPSLVVA